jgi:DNA replication protein DnaC
MDGRLLAQAREEKEDIRRRSMAEDDRRHKTAYARIPQLKALDGRLAALVGEVAASVMGNGRPVDQIRQESLALQAQRAELLTEHGFPMDWLDGAWACPQCRDTGYVAGKPCACLLELYEKARARDLSALLKLGDERFETFDLTWYDDEPAPGSGVSPRQQMSGVLGFCRDYAERFGKNSVNLLFRGNTGLGKTFLSACIARVVSQKGYSVVYETTVAALAAFETQKFRPGGDSAQAEERVRQILTCDLLILDDLGTEMVTEFSKSALYTLINTRLLDNKKTVISTNLSETEMARLYTPQICSRLKGEYQDLRFSGTDIRQLRKERGLG